MSVYIGCKKIDCNWDAFMSEIWTGSLMKNERTFLWLFVIHRYYDYYDTVSGFYILWSFVEIPGTSS